MNIVKMYKLKKYKLEFQEILIKELNIAYNNKMKGMPLNSDSVNICIRETLELLKINMRDYECTKEIESYFDIIYKIKICDNFSISQSITLIIEFYNSFKFSNQQLNTININLMLM